MTAPDLTEKEWQAQVVDLARTLSWIVYHTFDSRRSQPGFPDLVLVRERVIFCELKTAKGKLSAPQKVWVRRLLDAGAETYVVRPSDLDALARVLGARHRVADGWWSSEQARIAAASLRVRTYAETGLEVAA